MPLSVALAFQLTRGRGPRTPHDILLSAGTYRLQWDGRLSSGQPAGSGVYIYRLTSGDITLSRKMVLLK